MPYHRVLRLSEALVALLAGAEHVLPRLHARHKPLCAAMRQYPFVMIRIP